MKLLLSLLCTSALIVPLATAAHAQEIKNQEIANARQNAPPKIAKATSVSQDMLNHAAGDNQNFLQTNGDYSQQR